MGDTLEKKIKRKERIEKLRSMYSTEDTNYLKSMRFVNNLNNKRKVIDCYMCVLSVMREQDNFMLKKDYDTLINSRSYKITLDCIDKKIDNPKYDYSNFYKDIFNTCLALAISGKLINSNIKDRKYLTILTSYALDTSEELQSLEVLLSI